MPLAYVWTTQLNPLQSGDLIVAVARLRSISGAYRKRFMLRHAPSGRCCQGAFRVAPRTSRPLTMLKAAVVLPIAMVCFQYVGAATITVNTSELLASADDGLCTLTEAVEAANSNSPSGALAGECAAGEAGPVQDVIEFEPSLFPAHFFLVAPLNLTESIRIEGPGAEVMKLTNLAETRVFDIMNFELNAQIMIRGMTLQDNVLRAITGAYGGAIEASLSSGASLILDNMVFFNNASERGGGAIGLFGGTNNSITIRNCLFEDNRAGNFGNGDVVGGGALFIGADQTVVIENSSFIDNHTFHASLTQPQDDAAGGAILIRSGQTLTSSVDIFQSTFSGNSATGVGGAIALGGPGFPADISELSIRHSTLVLNESDSNEDQVVVAGGGGVWSASSAPVQIFNSIVARNIDNATSPAPDLHGSMDSFGFNLIGDNATVAGTFPLGQPNSNDDWVGSTATPLDPMLEPLAYSGGPTPVHQPMILSPLLDQGRCASRLTDQRLFHNPQTGRRIVDIGNIADAEDGCDIGAVERFGASADPVPVANDDNYTALEDQPLVVSAANGLLQNDLDDDALIVIDVREVAQRGAALQAQVSATADGAFVFESLSEDQSGQVEFTYVISDKLNTDSATLLIQVLPVNDPPQFEAAPTQVSATPGETVIIEDWAFMGPGPADEQGQSLAFLVTEVSAPEGFFISPPSIDIDGFRADLSFELAPQAAGSAEFSVVLQDSGGTANGGIDKSEALLLTISALGDQIFRSRFESE